MAATASTVERATALVAEMGGLAILAATLAAVTAVVYRWYVRELVPRGLSLLVGLSGVAVYLNTTTALGQVIEGATAPTEVEQALFNIAAFAIAAGGAAVGRRAGDQFGTDVLLGDGLTDVDDDVGRLVKSVGRVVTVELPEDIDDVTGYDPVPEETKAKLAGRTFLFPRRLTVDDLRERLVHRLKTDYAVGHVDVELADDGHIEYLALGSRAAGIGPTLPPATNAVAIRADPAFAASAGDLVQVWETDPMRRVLTAELRGVADETVTIAIDAADTPKVDPVAEYRLVTLPVADRPDREFASLLRAAEETFSSVAVEAGSPLHGLPVGALTLAVVAVQPEGGKPVALPESSYVLAPGDIVSAIARPDVLRRLEAAAEALDPSVVRHPEPADVPGERTTADPPAAASGDEDETGQTETTESETPGGDATEGETEPKDSDTETAEDADRAAPDDGTGETATGDDEPTGGQAGPESFEQLKEEFESGEADWDDEKDENGTGGSAPTEAATGEQPETQPDDGGEGESGDGVTSPQAGPESFEQFKAEFESGEADWDDSEVKPDDPDGGSGFEDETEEGTGFEDDPSDALAEATDDLDRLLDDEEAEDEPGDVDDGTESADDELDDLGFEEAADDGGFTFDEEGSSDDDLAALGGGDDEEESLGLDFDEGDGEEDGEEEGAEDESDEDDEDDDDEDDDDEDDDSGGGGGKSFQQLKEEFESGEADWEDDVSDSPGGDMRLDE